MSGTNSPSAPKIDLNFEFRDDNILYAVFSENPAAGPMDVATAKQLIESLGFNELYFYSHAFEEIEGRLKRLSVGEIAIAEKQDAKVEVSVDSDSMSAFITTIPAYGGEALTAAKLVAAIEEKGVLRKCLQKESIKEALASTRVTDFRIAKGKLPRKGKDSRFEVLIEDTTLKDLRENDSGAIDHNDSHEYSVVDKDTELLRRLPPTEGTPGYDVYGNEIPAEPGEVVPFAKDMSGTRVSESDPNLILADLKGHPVVMANSVKVDPVLHFKNVSLATGHINFEGSVEITGDVMPNMKIKVTGDVLVKGVVERAHIIAGNNIIIHSGVVGEDPNDERPEYRAYLKAGGAIQARYVNLSRIEARHNIEIREYALNCSLRAGDHILLGQEGGRGQIIGGTSTAGNSIKAKVIGSDAYLPTELMVGASAEMLKDLVTLKEKYKEQGKEAKALANHLKEIKQGKFSEAKDEAFIRKVKEEKKAYLDLRKRMAQTLDQINWIEYQAEVDEDKHILAGNKIYPNVKMAIDNSSAQTDQPRGHAVYRVVDGKISVD